VKWLLIIGAIVVVLFATGRIHLYFYTTSEPAPAAGSSGAANVVSSPIGAPPPSSHLGTGVRTAADVRWIRRMNVFCARRNGRENSLPAPEDTTTGLARYAAQTLWIWGDYRHQANGLPSPTTYAAEAAWVEQADDATGTAIQSVLDAARSDNRDAAHVAIAAFQSLSETTLRTYRKIGLRACGQFHP